MPAVIDDFDEGAALQHLVFRGVGELGWEKTEAPVIRNDRDALAKRTALTLDESVTMTVEACAEQSSKPWRPTDSRSRTVS